MAEPALPPSRKLRYGAEAAAFFFMMGLFRLMPLDMASRVGGWMGRNIFALLPPDRIARANLKAAFPEKSQAEIETILSGMWDNLGRVVAEYPHLSKFDSVAPGARIELTGKEHADAAVAAGKGVLFLAGHISNWEMGPICAKRIGLEGASVVRHPNNPYVARYIAWTRAQQGPSEQISKHSGARRIFSQLRGGKAIYMLVDQRNDEGIAVPFFGQDAMTTPVPAALALRLGAQILYTFNQRKKGQARFHITVHPAPQFQPTGDKAADTRMLTEMITAEIEAMIRKDPAQWLWIHNRWKVSRDRP